MRIRRRWANHLLSAIGWKSEREGDAPDYPCMIVSNHRSHIDPILFLREIDAFPVAKAEMASWPVIGRGAQMAGILYVDRGHSGSRTSILRQMLEKVNAGFQVLIFPEGTTSGLSGTLPFKTGGFRMAAQHGIPVVPAALIFPDPRDFWVGKVTLWQHIFRRGGEKTLEVKLVYGPRLQDSNPEKLMLQAREWINERLSAE